MANNHQSSYGNCGAASEQVSIRSMAAGHAEPTQPQTVQGGY